MYQKLLPDYDKQVQNAKKYKIFDGEDSDDDV